jgi:hypothetical protein
VPSGTPVEQISETSTSVSLQLTDSAPVTMRICTFASV